MRKYHKQRLLKLADYLEGLQQKLEAQPVDTYVPRGWNFGSVLAKADDRFGHPCGTAGCALGHLSDAFPEQITPEFTLLGDGTANLTLVRGNVYRAPFEMAEYFFGLTLFETGLLFDFGAMANVRQSALGLPYLLKADTMPIQVAENIRAFVALK